MQGAIKPTEKIIVGEENYIVMTTPPDCHDCNMCELKNCSSSPAWAEAKAMRGTTQCTDMIGTGHYLKKAK